ncbi:MAG: hypothetical protein ACOC9H_02375, partial [Gemmatimonadota bacterium]
MTQRSAATAPVLAAGLLLWAAAPAQGQELERFQPDGGYTLPPTRVQDFFERDTNFAILDQVSPDGNHFLVPLATELSTLERMAEPTLRLAGLELRPDTDRQWHLDTWGIYGFRIYALADRAFREVTLPDEAFASDFMWSPDGDRLAFLAHLRDRTELWTAEAATGRTRPVSDLHLMTTLGTSSRGQGSRPSEMLQWTPEGTLLTLATPPERDAEPTPPSVPPSPGIRRTRDEAVSTRTLPFLLEDEHDEDLLEHYTTSRIVELSEGSEPRFIGEPAMYRSISLSPDGH